MLDYKKVRYKVICNLLHIRTQPTIQSNMLEKFYIKGEIIKTGTEPFKGFDGRYWVKYLSVSNVFRYVCYQDLEGVKNLVKIESEDQPLTFKESSILPLNEIDLKSPSDIQGLENDFSLEFSEKSTLIKNEIDFNFLNDSDTNKKILFNTYQKPQKHNKFSNDNMLKRIKTLSINIIKNRLNSEIKSTNLLELKDKELLQISQEEKINKTYYINLLNSTFREIFSSNKYKNRKDYNKELINKIYEIYERDKSGKDFIGKKINDIVNFLNKTYLEFWNGLTIFLNNNNISIEETNENNEFFISLLENFNSEVFKDLNEKKETKDYIEKIQFTIKDFPSKIYQMKEIKSKS